MQLPRKGILIRVVIYGSLLSYFGYQAWSRYQAEKTADAEVQLPAPKKVQLPDGRSIEVIEVTPEQAAALSGSPAAFERGDAPASPPAPAPAPEAAPPEAAPSAPVPAPTDAAPGAAAPAPAPEAAPTPSP